MITKDARLLNTSTSKEKEIRLNASAVENPAAQNQFTAAQLWNIRRQGRRIINRY